MITSFNSMLDLCGPAHSMADLLVPFSHIFAPRQISDTSQLMNQTGGHVNEPALVHASCVPCHRRAPEQAAKVHNCWMRKDKRKDSTVQRQFGERRNITPAYPGSSAWQIYWCMHSVANAGKELTGRLGGRADMNMLAPAAFEEAPRPPRPAFAPGLPAA